MGLIDAKSDGLSGKKVTTSLFPDKIAFNYFTCFQLKNHTITVRISDMFKAYKEGSLQAGLNNRCGFERYDFMEWLQKNYL